MEEQQGSKPRKNTKQVNIVNEMRSSYINYAMSVIVARALPEVRDGLKPVQRRIIYAMYKLGFLPSKAYKKSARTVGDVIGKYHPHGDTAVYDAMVRMAQDFSFRYPLVDGQGNFGSIDGDKAAAMRYTEAKLARIALEFTDDLDKNTVDFVETYDGSYQEPRLLPTTLPAVLLNGSEGIAVGMATKIPPHNLGEILSGIIAMIEAGNKAPGDVDKSYVETIRTTDDLDKLPKDRFPEFMSEIGIEKLIEYIPGPDFPTGAEIYDQKEIMRGYATGKGRVLMRGVTEIEEKKNGKMQIVISELPYQVNKANLVQKIANLYRDKKIKGISDLRDESTKDIRVVIEVKRDTNPNTVLNKLYKYTELQSTFNMNLLALVDSDPQVLNLPKFLELFIQHRQEVVIRRNEYILARSREREHILEGLMIALDNLDEVISTIRNSADSEVAKTALMSKFKLSEIQAQAILDMQLRRLAALERQKIEDEYKEIKAKIAAIIELLKSPEAILATIKTELVSIKEKYADPRRTKVFKGKVGEINEEDLIADKEVFITISQKGYIKRMNQSTYKVQKRGGKGKKVMETREDDYVEHLLSCSNHDEILFFTNQGRVFSKRVFEIPEYSRQAKGKAVINLINIDQNELITSVLTRDPKGKIIDEDISQEQEKTKVRSREFKYLFMATKDGLVKKTKLEEFTNIRTNGLIAIKLNSGDELIWVKPSSGNDEIVLITRNARSIRFTEKDVRSTGRDTMGVKGITFKAEDDEIIVMDIIRKEENLVLTISEKGFGKVSEINQFPTQKRGGQGVYAARVNPKTGRLASARILDHPQLQLLILTKQGKAVRIPTNNLPERNRQTQGVKLMNVGKGDQVSAIAIVEN